MEQDVETNNFIGAGEESAIHIIEQLTGLHPKGLKHFPLINGIYRQVPISWLLKPYELCIMSDSHKKGSIDIFIKLDKIKIAVRIQGKGHGMYLKGIGKAQHDKVQAKLLENHCQVVDVLIQECPNIFRERVNQHAINEMIYSFKTAKVMIPSIKRE